MEMCETMNASEGGFRGLLELLLVSLSSFAVGRGLSESFGGRGGVKGFVALWNLMVKSMY